MLKSSCARFLAIALLLPSAGYSYAQGAADGTAPKAPSEPIRTESVQYGAWLVNCQQAVSGAGRKNCAATLRTTDKDKKLAFAWVLTKTADGKPIMVIQTPTGVAIPAGVELGVGKGAARKIAFSSCEPQFCEAIMVVDPALATEIKTSPKPSLAIQGKDGRKFKFDIDTKGVEQAFSAIGF
jgi:invasion protein IalB